jgi:hypothetical protein
MGACAVIEEAIAQAVLGGRVGGTRERLREPVDGRCLRRTKTTAASSLQGAPHGAWAWGRALLEEGRGALLHGTRRQWSGVARCLNE